MKDFDYWLVSFVLIGKSDNFPFDDDVKQFSLNPFLAFVEQFTQPKLNVDALGYSSG